MKLLRNSLIGLICTISITILSFIVYIDTSAQSNLDIVWNAPRNLSNSPEKTSTDPFLLSDPTGKVHLFWAEKQGAMDGNQPDTVMYTVGDGSIWRRPVDLFFSPDSSGTPLVAYPQAVMDDTGRIHLFWLEQPNFPNYTLFYSSANANEADNAVEWKVERRLADDLTGTKYSFDIKFRPPNELHVFYARVRQGDNPPEERAISYIRSTDLGETWSDPIDIYSFHNIRHGGSDVGVALDTENRIYVTWTEWDETGNGWRVWFCRSVDNGLSWESPIALSERVQNEYERDWASLFVLEEGKLVVMWEGGWRAFRYAQYSDDGGVSWTKPVDTFPWLIGENGTVEYARDSNDVIHLFIAQRVREGFEGYGDSTNAAVWHGVWLGGRSWSQPQIVTPAVNLINPKVAVFGGNRVVLTWYTQGDLEIMVMTGQIQDAPYVAKPAWTNQDIVEPTPMHQVTQEPTLERSNPSTATVIPFDSLMEEEASNNGLQVIIIGIVLALLVIGILYWVEKKHIYSR